MDTAIGLSEKVGKAINEYQCPGCGVGCYLKHGCDLYKKRPWGESCDAHSPGTSIGLSFKIFLGMPVGFNRTGVGMADEAKLKLDIFESLDTVWDKDGNPYDNFNVPVWKHLNEAGHTLVRGYSPRNNAPFLHVILEDCMDRIDCFEVTEELMKQMD